MDERDESWLPLPEDERGCVVTPHDGYPTGVLHIDLLPILLPRRFLVVMDVLKPENLESSSVLQGLEYLEVPGSATKDYKLTFLSYKEGVFNTTVSVDSSLWGPSGSCGLPEKLHSLFSHLHGWDRRCRPRRHFSTRATRMPGSVMVSLGAAEHQWVRTWVSQKRWAIRRRSSGNSPRAPLVLPSPLVAAHSHSWRSGAELGRLSGLARHNRDIWMCRMTSAALFL